MQKLDSSWIIYPTSFEAVLDLQMNLATTLSNQFKAEANNPKNEDTAESRPLSKNKFSKIVDPSTKLPVPNCLVFP